MQTLHPLNRLILFFFSPLLDCPVLFRAEPFDANFDNSIRLLVLVALVEQGRMLGSLGRLRRRRLS